MIEGWFEIPRATNIEEASKHIIRDSINKVLDYCIREDHLWTLIKFCNMTVINCYLIKEDELGGYCYQPCADEDYPEFNDIPFEWLSRISSPEERKTELNQDFSNLKNWIESVKKEYLITKKEEPELEKEME